MLRSKTSLLLLLFAPCAVFFDVTLKNSENYGPYTVSFGDLHLCSGPKRDNASHVETRFREQDDIAQFNVSVFEDTAIDEIRLTVYNVKGRYRSVLWNYKFKDPCRFYAISNVIEKVTHEKNCIVRKGRHSFYLNVKDSLETFVGKSFFYGDFSLKSIVLSKRGNVFCGLQDLNFKKKI